MSFFALNSQEVKESETTQTEKLSTSEITFSLENKSENKVPKIIIHRDGFWDGGSYKFLDGEKISEKELDKLLKAEADQIFVKKSKIFNGIAIASGVGILASFLTSIYASYNDLDYLAEDALIPLSIFCSTGIIARIAADNYEARAIDSYNLNVLGLNQNK